MNLILQGINPEPITIKKLLLLANAQSVIQLNKNAWWCKGVPNTQTVKSSIEDVATAAKIDYAFMPKNLKLKDFGLVVMDMDSTLITIECIDEIADMQGLKPQVAEITESAMRGEIEFLESLHRRVALLEGLDVSALEKVYNEKLRLSPGAEKMLATMQKAGLKTVLVSGGFTYFTDRLKTHLKLDYTHSNLLEVVNGRLTGKVIGTVVDAEEKKNTVERICQEIGIPSSKAIVIGDGANDLKMMDVAGLSVAFHAKPIVSSQADVALNFVGLDGVLNLFAQ